MPLQAQQLTREYNNYLWKSYTGNFRFSSRWGLHTDLQFRWNGAWSQFRQFIGRSGVEYLVSPQLTVTAGYAFAYNDVHTENLIFPHSYEHRGWQQIIIQNAYPHLRIQHRYRLENRWFYKKNILTGETFQTYANRFRYQLRVVFPVVWQKHPTRWLLNASAEGMINFGKNIRYNLFDQTRLNAGAGYQLSNDILLQIMYQQIFTLHSNGNEAEFANVILFSVVLRHDFMPAE